jgi:hypothetical protein
MRKCGISHKQFLRLTSGYTNEPFVYLDADLSNASPSCYSAYTHAPLMSRRQATNPATTPVRLSMTD